MFDSYIRQLNDADPTIRRQAIVALANLGDPRALPALATIYRNDPELTLRDLALKAGQHIKTRTGSANSVPTASPAPISTPRVVSMPQKALQEVDIKPVPSSVSSYLSPLPGAVSELSGAAMPVARSKMLTDKE